MPKLFILLFFFLSLISCKNGVVKENDIEARKLFSRSSEILLEFIEKFQNSSDSISIDSLQIILERKLVDINFEISPETDLKLTEEENDSIFKLMEKINLVKKEKLKSLSQVIQFNDSITEGE